MDRCPDAGRQVHAVRESVSYTQLSGDKVVVAGHGITEESPMMTLETRGQRLNNFSLYMVIPQLYLGIETHGVKCWLFYPSDVQAPLSDVIKNEGRRNGTTANPQSFTDIIIESTNLFFFLLLLRFQGSFLSCAYGIPFIIIILPLLLHSAVHITAFNTAPPFPAPRTCTPGLNVPRREDGKQ